jgi:DNA-binding transcriptional LysR family regulator
VERPGHGHGGGREAHGRATGLEFQRASHGQRALGRGNHVREILLTREREVLQDPHAPFEHGHRLPERLELVRSRCGKHRLVNHETWVGIDAEPQDAVALCPGSVGMQPLPDVDIGREGDAAARERGRNLRCGPDRHVLGMLLLEEGHCLRDHAIAACGPRRGTWESRVEATSLTTLIQMVEGGLGVTLLPGITLETGILKGTRLVARRFSPPVRSRTLALVARRTSPRRRDADLLADFLIDQRRGSR